MDTHITLVLALHYMRHYWIFCTFEILMQKNFCIQWFILFIPFIFVFMGVKCTHMRFSDHEFNEFRDFWNSYTTRLLHPVFVSLFLFSWTGSVYTCVLLTMTLPNFMHFWDSYTTKFLHSVIIFIGLGNFITKTEKLLIAVVRR